MENKMTMIDWYKKVVFQNYANFKGRARRSEYWWFALANFLIMIVLSILGNILGTVGMAIYGIYSLAVLVPSIAVAVRRLHDIGKSGWWIAGFYALIFAFYGYAFSKGLFIAGASPESFANASVGATFGLFGLVIFIIAIIMLVWLFKNSQPGTNKWGPNPKEDKPDSFDFEQQQFHQ